MTYPNLYQEKRLWKQGYKLIAGLDEAGRGPLAGPVLAGAVSITNRRFINKDFRGLKDSKKLSAKQREKFYKLIVEHPDLEWGIGKVSEKIIDRVNILEATKLAMAKAIVNLNRKLKSELYPFSHDRRKMGITDFLILDGNFKINNTNVPQKSIIKGDEKVFSCAAASVIAKVTRDRIMTNYHEKYPKYRFDLHKGYATKLHMTMLKKHGFCEIHRKTFRPIAA
ncbi:ribonuclease HII [Candidatus Parcubacteria bacterium]|nr:ribonuclease HII [Patescibacteria group bacterium]MBU4466650.1 ribonuclease HII [Patescibacteria group bacterium]MCG2688162.1 ribonuclease HII [Candidatus Parcubacteria bacterium]